MKKSTTPGNAASVITSLEEKMEADASSIYVGNVDYVQQQKSWKLTFVAVVQSTVLLICQSVTNSIALAKNLKM
ncbi:Polyadenylate-binding protein 2 [Microtus ochrogaster]|uniref:Polyadenylate-binding protein 2 n=1 Tax=Microtus ochrogaster TaxID=79684 RepID=A0A8J6G2S9_MICOH|nr:Polyadenylate-binding protein 2 [Microtus ochrogaster]